jgi:glutathione S-transferase
MAKMKLYYSPGSPYARKVRVVAMETRLDRKMEMVNVAVSPVVPNADVDKHNPIGKIPALSVKGMDLFDSPVICEYLDSHHKGRKLLPRKLEVVVTEEQVPDPNGIRFPPTTRRSAVISTGEGSRWQPVRRQRPP